MVLTRSKKEFPVNSNTEEMSTAGTTTGTSATEATTTTGTSATETTTTTGTGATETTTTGTSAMTETTTGTRNIEKEQVEVRPQPPRSRTSRTSKSKRKELAKAKVELLQRQVELAAARVAAMEVDTSDEEMEDENVTVREERTSQWIKSNTLALTMEPHYKEANQEIEAPQSTDIIETTGPPPVQNGGANRRIEDTRARCTSEPLNSRIPQGVCHEQPFKNIEQANHGYNSQPLARYSGQEAPQTRRDIDYNELASAITLAARAIQPPVHLRIQELPTFSGVSSEWLPFKAAYEETENHLSEQENLARLRKSLRGAAREAVQCLFVGSTSANQVMRLLASRFGRPDALVMAEMNRLKTLPRLSENPRDICIFASKVLNVTATVRALNKNHYLYNAEVVRQVVEKLPSALRYRYYDYAAEQHEDQPDLITLAAFLECTAARCSSFAPAEIIVNEDRREPKKAIKSYHTQDQRASAEEITCVFCKENHRSSECSKFKDSEVSTRWDMAREYKLCFRCLKTRKFRHVCKTKKCEVNGCQYTHHPLLHSNTRPQSKEKTANNVETSLAVTVASAKEVRNTTTLLKILPIEVSGPKGTYNTYALLDDGSTCSLIETAVAKQVGATGPNEPFYIEGVAGTRINAGESRRVRFNIRGRSDTHYEISARTMEDLQLSSQTVPSGILQDCLHLRDIQDQLVYEEGTPTVLIGQDNWHLLITHETRQGDRHQPVASRTNLGWVLHGIRDARARSQKYRINHVKIIEDDASIEEMMKQHFALESIGVEPKRSYNNEEKRALKQLEENTRRLPAGGFETGLLWKEDNPCPPNSYDMALRRLEHVEKKLERDNELKQRYEAQIQVLLQNGYAEEAPIEKNKNTWYLPHFAVINPQKPGKLRIVHDAAAIARGISLNSMLLSGPDLLQSLPGVLMKFRQRAVAVTADIKDMFLRVTIREEDRDMQRFLWRGGNTQSPPKEYRMKSVIFGATSSPCTAIYVKNRNAEEMKTQYPEAAAAIVNNHYVDDYLMSADSEEEALRVSRQVEYVHSRGNFFLQRWTSNSRRVLEELSPSNKGDTLQLDREKILGMIWEPESDTLSFNINKHKIPTEILEGQKTPTKREALRTVMSIFDPLGIATPVTIQAKRIMQEVWRSGIDWDAQLQHNEAELWRRWIEEVQKLTRLTVPRCYARLSHARCVQIHTFVDASSSAYAAVTYWRVVGEDGQIHVSLIMAKGKVAPLKVISIPRLELQAAVLGCRLSNTSIEEHDIKPSSRYYWTDSRTVLSWIRTGPRAYKPFVAHRIAEITETTKTKEWRWVPTKMNVADDATRDVPQDFASHHRWLQGPEFLYQSEEQWPAECENNTAENSETGEERIHTVVNTPRLTEALPSPLRYSNWLRLIRTTARVLQFIDILRSKQRCTATRKRTKENASDDPTWTRLKKKIDKVAPRPTSGEKTQLNFRPIEERHLQSAQSLWVRAQQEEIFNEEIAALRKNKQIPTNSRLYQLAIVLDKDGVIRLRSRVAATEDITLTQREPAIIDGNHPWTRLYISWTHAKLHHGGFETTANEVRQHYWVLRLRNAVRSEVKRCQKCKIRHAKPAQPSTGDHPRSRLAHHRRPFTYTGLDYFGPMSVTVGRTHQKRYGVLFTCLTTRAVHLEIAGSLSTDSAIMALRRFISRRGCPTELWSDQGTNLRGADQEMKKAVEEAMQEEASVQFIKWRYIPPSAPFMGGAWERMVRSVKTALYVTLHERSPKEEVLATLLAEVENTVNSRPLTHVSTSPEDEEALTPNHFLLGGPSRVPLPGTFTDGDFTGRKEWRASQRLADMFWSRWIREYLPELQHRREPRAHGAIKMNDLVLIADGTLPRNSWPRGVVVAVYPGPDGEVRAVDVRTNKGVLRRPTKKLVILPTEADEMTPATSCGGRKC